MAKTTHLHRDKDTGAYTEYGIAKRTEYNKENYSSISVLMKPEEYALFKECADKRGMKFATWMQEACSNELKELGIIE